MLTYAVQKVGKNSLPVEPQGATNFDAFMGAIDAFPWAAQLAAWNENQDGPLPALVLQNKESDRELWVTALFTELAASFQVHAMSMQLRKGLFGFGKPKLSRNVTTVELNDRNDMSRLCRMFCDGDYEALDLEVARLAEC